MMSRPYALTAPPRAPATALSWMNQRHCVVLDGGKTFVMTESYDPDLDRCVLKRSAFADLERFYTNRIVRVPTNDEEPRSVNLGKFWLTHSKRRQYEGIVFDPSQKAPPQYYNLWRGFAVAPDRSGDWSLMAAHIRNVICRADETLYGYVMGWMATAVQRPELPAEVALVLRGGQGTGKGVFAREFGKLFGQHFIHVANACHLTGNFNAHLQDALVIFADEAFGTHDKQARAVLKMLITEPTLVIERKYHDAFTARNRTHLIIASNEQWVIPAGLDERRFCVLDVNDAHAQDLAYFASVVGQMALRGRAAMLADLLAYDVSEFDVRQGPVTAALQEQRTLSMSPVQQWWFQKLRDGHLLPADRTWCTRVLRDDLHQDYATFTGRANDRGTVH